MTKISHFSSFLRIPFKWKTSIMIIQSWTVFIYLPTNFECFTLWKIVFFCLPMIDFKRDDTLARIRYDDIWKTPCTCICVLQGIYLIYLKIDIFFISQYSQYIKTTKWLCLTLLDHVFTDFWVYSNELPKMAKNDVTLSHCRTIYI